MVELILEGSSFSDLAGFYDEVERKLTKNLDWKIGRNLDAFNDVLRGGFGVFEYSENITLIWKDSNLSKNNLGFDAAIKRYNDILKKCHPSNIPNIKERIFEAEQKRGLTLFDEIVEIIRENKNIKLTLD
jgi:RNAse (barnase) inhibitor barstar